MRVQFSWSIYDAEDNETEYTIVANCTPGDPGRWTLSNGDPGYPPTGPEVEIEEIKNDQDSPIDPKEWAAHGFNAGILAQIEDCAIDKAEDKAADERDEEAP